MSKATPTQRERYNKLVPITTRWLDNDVYGHVNNVVYYSYFDTAVNQTLIRLGLLDLEKSEAIGLVVETQCQYFASLKFPDDVQVGILVAALGNSSVTYELAVFKNNDQSSCALGRFVHVYVDKVSRKPIAIPQEIRAALQQMSRAS